MSTSKITTLVTTGAAFLASLGAVNAQFVAYDNTQTPVLTPSGAPQSYPSADEYGDQIGLKLGPRTVQSFSFDYYASYSQTSAGILRFYKNDGPGGAPGELLYESGRFDLKSGYNKVEVNFTSIPFEVPDTFTWTVKLDGVDPAANKTAGLLLYNPPGPGASNADFWVRNGTVWSLSQLSGPLGVQVANFNAKLVTVPEPSTYALVGVGMAAWMGSSMLRRNRK